MPATAPQPEPDGGHMLAPVVSLAGRRGAKTGATDSTAHVPTMDDATDNDLAEQAYRHWARVFRTAGIDLGSTATTAVVRLVTQELERLVSGFVAIREGHGDRLPPDPQAGVDFTSAVEITGVLRDLAHAAEAARTQH